MKLWWNVLRVRTLWLAAGVALCAAGLAVRAHRTNLTVYVLTLLTVLLLQTVSNIANDYGDGVRGTDNLRAAHAPKRMSAMGGDWAKRVRAYLVTAVCLAAASGLALIAASVSSWRDAWVFLGLGAVSLAAAMAYTIGRYAYGYYALGEAMVFVFFGLLGVCGGFYLQTHLWQPEILLPACGSGFLSAAVLNVNNMRDAASDRLAGKRTWANILGWHGSKVFQAALVGLGCLCYAVFVAWSWQSVLCYLALPLAVQHLARVWNAGSAADIGGELGACVRLHFVVNTLFALGLCLGA